MVKTFLVDMDVSVMILRSIGLMFEKLAEGDVEIPPNVVEKFGDFSMEFGAQINEDCAQRVMFLAQAVLNHEKDIDFEESELYALVFDDGGD